MCARAAACRYALRFSLLSHLFLRVLPLPLPIGREDRKLRCFWAGRNRDITHDTQAEILRWLSLLARHFAAASLSIPLAPTADATRIFVFASIAAIADAVLRRTACDLPSALSLHYSGEAEGPAGPFALEMRHFEVESERAQLPSPHLAAARTMLLDYFRSASIAVPSDRHVFRYERSMELGSGERTLLSQLCCQLAYPREEANLCAYLSGEGSLSHTPTHTVATPPPSVCVHLSALSAMPLSDTPLLLCHCCVCAAAVCVLLLQVRTRASSRSFLSSPSSETFRT